MNKKQKRQILKEINSLMNDATCYDCKNYFKGYESKVCVECSNMRNFSPSERYIDTHEQMFQNIESIIKGKENKQ